MELLILVGIVLILRGIFSSGDSQSGGNSLIPLEGRLRKTHLASNEPHSSQRGPEIIAVEIKGAVSCNYVPDTTVITLAHDVTDPNNRRPLISHLKEFQEPGGYVYQYRRQNGPLNDGYGCENWIRVSLMGLDIVSPPESGRRNIEFITWIIDTSLIPQFRNGFFMGEPPIVIWQDSQAILIDFDHGYEEIDDNEIPTRQATIYLAMSVAMADGDLHDREGTIIKEWMTKTIDSYPAKAQAEAKKRFNKTLRKSHEASKGRKTAPLYRKWADTLNQLSSSDHQKYDAIQLCYDVLAADDDARKEELEQVKEIAAKLNLDYEEIEKMKDRALVNVQAITEDSKGVEDLLGIDPSWTTEKKLDYLQEQFEKWNQRMISSSPGQQRDQAEQMVNRIAEAQKKYAK